MEGGSWAGEGMQRGMGREWDGLSIRYGRGQERWPDGHDKEWKSAIDEGEEVEENLYGVIETLDKGGTQESMGVTLPVTHYIGDMEVNSCSQMRTLVEW
jgi:hypothetical protein